MIEKKERIRELDILRGLSAVLMILGHSFIIHPINISKVPWCFETQHLIYNFHMELFFLIAGAVYYCNNYSKFILGKAKQLIIPYIFFGVINALIHAYGGDIVSKMVPIKEGLLKLLCKGGGYWFIFSLFTVFLVFPIIEKVCNKKWKEAVFVIALLVVREIVELPTLFLIDTTAYYLPYFILGHMFFPLIKIKTDRNNHWMNAVVAVLSVVLYVFVDILSRGYDINRKLLDYVRSVAIIMFFIIVVHYFVMLADKIKFFKMIEKFLQNCSRYSLQFYLFNGYLLGMFRIIICHVLEIETPIIIVLSLLIGNVVFTYVVCERIIPYIPVVRTLCGLKKKEAF